MDEKERTEREHHEFAGKPPKPEDECCEHPHFRPPFPPPGREPHRHWEMRRHFHPKEHVPHDFDFYLMLAGEISLTEEQMKKLHSIKMKCEKNRIMIMARLRVAELDLQEMLNQSKLDLDKIDAKVREIGEIKIESDLNDIHSMIESREVLTPEQKEKLKTLRPVPCNCHFIPW